MAVVASSTPSAEGEPCFIYPYAVSIASPKGDTPAALFDFNKESALEASLEDFPITVTLQPSGPRLFLNSLRVWPSSEPAASVGAFSLEGRSGSSAFAPILSRANLQYEVNTYRRFPSYFHADAYQTFRLHLTSVAGAPYFLLVEMQPMTCNTQMPTTIQFSPSSYSVYANNQQLRIAPDVNEFSDCSIQPALPAGLRLDAASCVVSGKATAALSSTVFTVTSQMSGLSISGTFTLEVLACAGTLLSVLRTYKELAADEAFSLRDVETQQVVLSVALNGGQSNNQDWSATLCVTNARYVVSVSSGSLNWYEQSFLFVRAGLLGEEQETIARVRYEMHLGLPAEREINAQRAVAPQSAWQYKMGSVDDGWQTDAGWESAVMGFFPASSNQIQLYKKTFNVASLEGVAGFVMSLRYLYGCVIYLNNVEVFRNGVSGDLSSSSVGLNAYTDLLYRQISLPVKTMGVESVTYMQEGTNTIAIAIVAQTASQTTSVFDCAVRLALGGSRVFDYAVTHSLMEGFPALLANFDSSRYMAQKTCGENFWTLTFENNRREWISSVTLYLQYTQGVRQPRQFVLKARNTNLEAWTTLKNVTGMTWSLVGEHKRIWVENNKPYNQYRFENFGTGNEAVCSWRISAIDIAMDLIPATVPELTYSTPIVINKDVEMGEVYPNSEYFFDFTVTPALPAGIVIDSLTGKISGTANAEMPATTYSITAKKVGGGSSTAAITLSVEICTGTKGLITLVARMDNWPHEGSYKLYQGRGTTGQVIQSTNGFKVTSGLNYGDFCLPYGIYTVEVLDSQRDGWDVPAGWWLTVDLGAMIIDVGQIPKIVASVSTSFSSLIPFQINYSDWKLYNNEGGVGENWKVVGFDDGEWQMVKAAAMGNHMATTAYIRHVVQVPSLRDYHVLNVRVKYTGGLAVYFNGRLVARFNLEDEFDKSTEATTVHDASVFSKFHVILSTENAITGKNVMAFEVHRAPGQSEIVFDATGVFAVNECSVTVDTFSSITASAVHTCSKEDLLSLNPTIYGALDNEVGSYLAWTVENLEGSKWNSFALQTNEDVSSFGFSIYSRWEGDEFVSALAQTGQTMLDRTRSAWDMPIGIAGFTQFRYVIDTIASAAPSINAIVFQYCKPSGSGTCPGIGNYPSVGEGQISPAKCAEGFRGYSYRECTNGVLGEVKNDLCEYKLPARLGYENTNMEFVMNTQVSSGRPSYRNIIDEFYMQDSTPLPEGLKIDAKTGEITGIPVALMDTTLFTVRAENPAGETYVTITISVRKGYCQPEGVFEKTDVGEVAVYECVKRGRYVGTQKRVCVLGAKDGEWQKASGFCMPVLGVVLIVVWVINAIVGVVAIIIVVAVFLPMRARLTKAAGGVNGKNMEMVKKDPVTKNTTKAVTV